MSRNTLAVVVAVVAVVLIVLNSAFGWFSIAEPPAPAATAPEAGGTTQ